MKPRLVFISGREVVYIRNQVLIEALKDDFEVVVLTPPRAQGTSARIFLGVREFLRKRPLCDGYIVGFYGQPLAIILSWLQKKPIILDAYVSTYDTLCDDRRIFGARSLPGYLAQWLDRYSCQVSAKVITDTAADARYFQDTFGVPRHKIEPVYVGCDPTVFYPRPESHTKTSPFQIFYYGSFLPLHGTEVIVEAAAMLRKRSDIRLVLGGAGPEQGNIQQLIAKNRLDNVDMVGWIPFERLPDYIAGATVCLGGHFSAVPKAARVISTKTYQFIAMRKPTIVGDNPAIREVFIHGKDVWAVPMHDPAALANAIEMLVDHADTRDAIGQGGYEVFHARFTPEVIARQLRTLVQGVLCESVS